MTAWIVARQIPGKTDFELRYLDAIQYGPVHEFDTDYLTPEIGEELFVEFEQLYPLQSNWHITVESKPTPLKQDAIDLP